MRRRLALLVVLAVLTAALPGAARDKKKAPVPEPPPGSEEYEHPSHAFTFFLPPGWKVAKVADDPDALEASGDELIVRVVYRSGDVGYDALHAVCMMKRLTGQMDANPAVDYEYDYVESGLGSFRTLDSAFVVDYETPYQGHQKWRQRNLTVVGNGHSLCLIAFAPAPLWKKSKKVRSTLDAMLGNVKFRE